MTIHTAIIEAMRDIAKTGIAKLSKNKDQGYNFRGVEDAMNSLSPILIRHGIVVTSTYSDRTETERPTKSGGVMKFVTVKGAFKFAAADGSCIVTEAYGEGADTSDKATTKAMSVAFRTALFQQFVVPTMSMDSELDHEEIAVPVPQEALKAAQQGMLKYQHYWRGLTPQQRKQLEPHHSELKAIAEEADAHPEAAA